MRSRPPVLMIGLDAMEVELVEAMCADGRLPALEGLRRRGCFGALASNSRRFAGGVWPTLYTSRDVGHHGLYHNKEWRHERMRCEVPDEDWLFERPFWEHLDHPSRRIGIFDVPTTLGPPRPIHGLQLIGWSAHDKMTQGSWPRQLWGEVRRRFGGSAMSLESFGPQDGGTLARLRREMLASTEQLLRISEFYFAREAWDLFFVVFGATHRGGHYLWNLSQIDGDRLATGVRRTLEDGLADLYRASDRAVGRLLDRAPPGTRVLVFAAHGMGGNLGWSDFCDDLLGLILRTPPRRGFLYRLKRRLPWRLMRQVTTRLPSSVSNRLIELWSSRMFDWSATRYFPLPMDHAGYFRINLQGREPQGIVEPREYEGVCRELGEAFRSFRDVETGESIVDRVLTHADLGPPDAPYRDRLPDVVITWRGLPATASRGVRSEEFGELPLAGRRLPSGRSGNHRDRGWLVAAGQGIRPGRLDPGAGIMDVVPTVYRWLDEPVHPSFQGRPLPALLG